MHRLNSIASPVYSSITISACDARFWGHKSQKHSLFTRESLFSAKLNKRFKNLSSVWLVQIVVDPSNNNDPIINFSCVVISLVILMLFSIIIFILIILFKILFVYLRQRLILILVLVLFRISYYLK